MKRSILLSVAGLLACFFLMSQIEVMSNGDLRVGTGNTAIQLGKTGRFHSALNWNFNPGSSLRGLIMESGEGESGGFYADGDYAVIWSPGDGPSPGRLLRIYDEDNMYAGSTNYERAYIDGNGSYVTLSDERRKEDIERVESALGKLGKIDGVKYRYKQEARALSAQDTVNAAKPQKGPVTAGLLAQQVEAVIPEAVQTDGHGNKFMNYDAVTPYLVEALKEQQAQIEQLRAELAALKKK